MNTLNKLFVTILLCFFAILNAQQSSWYQLNISDLDLRKVEQPWWTAQRNKAINGETIRIAGENYRSGIGTISRSKIFVFLDGKSDRFTALVGIQDKQELRGELKFNALGDGNKLYYREDGKGKP
ncbi:NPCBM/NEW2 domain-containing protein [Aestuariivivens insulae]|uniref:NPCBM/NEW2 domain-containing protein n=1 Tax=Aestuariivivens insulae TaxID=1621988 RepID=UPI001F5878D1|nr:NPCBM/NEW2 domain-containing protein [Aestuariivivens insulae]